MRKEESDRLLELLEDAIHKSHCSQRELERRIGMGQGSLGRLFKGRLQLKVSHVYSIAHVLGIEPMSFFMQASPPKNPDWFLEQLGIRPVGGPRLLPAAGGPPQLSREEIRHVVRSTIHNELERIFEEQLKGDESGEGGGTPGS
jgi:transcriptional regulator with XRE-family HTH domain